MVALGPHHLPPSPPGRHCSLRPHTRARCPPVSSSMSSCVLLNVLLCLYMFFICYVICSPTMSSYVPLLCHPLYSPMHFKMFFCVFLDILLCHHVYLCLLMSSSCSFICPPPSYILLVSPAAFPLNVPLCLLAIILSSLVPSFMLLFCVHVFIKLFKSSIFHTNMLIFFRI